MADTGERALIKELDAIAAKLGDRNVISKKARDDHINNDSVRGSVRSFPTSTPSPTPMPTGRRSARPCSNTCWSPSQTVSLCRRT